MPAQTRARRRATPTGALENPFSRSEYARVLKLMAEYTPSVSRKERRGRCGRVNAICIRGVDADCSDAGIETRAVSLPSPCTARAAERRGLFCGWCLLGLANGGEPCRRKDRRRLTGEVGDGAHRELPGRPGGDGRAEVVEGHRQVDAGADLEVGGVRWIRAQHALGDPVVNSLEPPGERGEVVADGLVVGPVHAGRRGHDGSRGLDGETYWDPEPGALGIARERGAVSLERVPQDPPHGRLEHLLAPPLGVLHRDATLLLGRIEGRVRSDRVELAGDCSRPGELAATDRE